MRSIESHDLEPGADSWAWPAFDPFARPVPVGES